MLSWEESVREYRRTAPASAVLDNYYDLPPITAAKRFLSSEEFAAVLQEIGFGNGRTIVDLGAGAGMSSFALAESGWKVFSVEPDPSDEVGIGGIANLAADCKGHITALKAFGESLPLSSGSVDALYARQTLHHSNDLQKLMAEAGRVIKPNGRFLACREHVVDDEGQLKEFLANHPLHSQYGGEWAYSLSQYLQAAEQAGFVLIKRWGPEESIVNYFPGNQKALDARWREICERTWGPIGKYLNWSTVFCLYAVRRSQEMHRPPGRLFSFLWQRRG